MKQSEICYTCQAIIHRDSEDDEWLDANGNDCPGSNDARFWLGDKARCDHVTDSEAESAWEQQQERVLQNSDGLTQNERFLREQTEARKLK